MSSRLSSFDFKYRTADGWTYTSQRSYYYVQ